MSHRWHTSTAFSDTLDMDDHAAMRDCASLGPLEDYTNKYEQRIDALAESGTAP